MCRLLDGNWGRDVIIGSAGGGPSDVASQDQINDTHRWCCCRCLVDTEPKIVTGSAVVAAVVLLDVDIWAEVGVLFALLSIGEKRQPLKTVDVVDILHAVDDATAAQQQRRKQDPDHSLTK